MNERVIVMLAEVQLFRARMGKLIDYGLFLACYTPFVMICFFKRRLTSSDIKIVHLFARWRLDAVALFVKLQIVA